MGRRLTFAAIVLIVAWLPGLTAHALLDGAVCSTADQTLPALGGLLRTADSALPGAEICEQTKEPEPPEPSPEPEPSRTPDRSTDTPTVTTQDPTTQDQPATAPIVGVAAPEPSQVRPDRGQPEAPLVDDPVAPDVPETRFVPVASTGRTIGGGILLALAAALAGLLIGRRRGRHEAMAAADRTVVAALTSIPEAVIWTDADGKIRTLNPAAESMLAMTASAARGRTLWSAADGSLPDGTALARWLREHDAGSHATTATVGASSIPVALTTTDAGADGRVIVARDLRAERELRHMKETFLSNVSHELRTPLTSALGFARILRHRELSAEQAAGFTEAIVEACERLDHVIDLLLDVTALEGGKIPMEDGIDVRAAVDEAVAVVRDRAPAHVFAVQVADRVPAVRGNRALLRQALTELIENSVKFSPDGGLITVAASVQGTGAERTVRLAVSDQGIGIPAERVSTMLEDFEQGDGSATRAFGGLGIGLGFVRRVAHAHGGEVRIDSEPGRGTTVAVFVAAPAGATRRSRATARA